MFCKECGKSINDDSKFCSYCGSKVEPIDKMQSFENLSNEANNLHEVEQKTAGRTDYQTPEKSLKDVNLKRTAHFNWDLDGFPTDDSKKEKKVSIKWEDVLMSTDRDDGSTKMKRSVEGRRTDSFFFNSDDGHDAASLNKGYDGDDLQKNIFGDDSNASGDSGDEGIDSVGSGDSNAVNKFYTFNKKNEEFQRLLDREYEKLKNDENFEDVEVETKFMSDEPVEDSQKGGQESEGVLPSFPESNTGTEGTGEDEDADMGLLASAKQGDGSEPESGTGEDTADATTDADGSGAESGEIEGEDATGEPKAIEGTEDENNSADAKSHEGSTRAESGTVTAEAVAESQRRRRGRADHRKKTKFDFSAIFDDADSADSGNNIKQEKISKEAPEIKDVVKEKDSEISEAVESDQEVDKPKSKGMKVLSLAFYVVLIIVIVVLGIKLVAPDSSLAINIDRTYETIVDKITGKTPQGADVQENKTIDDWIADAASANQNISKIQSDPEVKVDITNKDFKGVDASNPFSDSIWYTTDDGKDVYYGGEIVKSVVAYYSDLNTSSGGIDDVKVDNLKIGEIRTGEFGFFVATSINDNKDKSGVYNLYIEPEGTVMKVSDSAETKKSEE